MIFDWLGSKKNKDDLPDLLAGFVMYQQVLGHIGKAKSLQKLNRIDEAHQILLSAEQMATSFLNQHPHEKKAHIMLAQFYIETGVSDRAEPILEQLLNSGEFQLNDDEELILSSKLLNIQRQRPSNQRSADTYKGFTQIYCCTNCGRLLNFISVPCPHCDWSPNTIEETARSAILSNSHFKVPSLLIIAREMANGRAIDDVVPNLLSDVKNYLSIPEGRQAVEKVFSLLRKNEHKNHRSLEMFRECSECGYRILKSGTTECVKCGTEVRWPEAVRLMVCMDNLLWFFEFIGEVNSSDAFSDLVCLLVAMTNNLLRKQEFPNIHDCQYSLKLLDSIRVISSSSKDYIVEIKNSKELMLYFVAEYKCETTEAGGLFLYQELEHFVANMTGGVQT